LSTSAASIRASRTAPARLPLARLGASTTGTTGTQDGLEHERGLDPGEQDGAGQAGVLRSNPRNF
jgi:hypothetical protein